MIFKSFLTGFISYVVAIIYNLLMGSNLERVFLSGIKYLFFVPILALLVQLVIYFIKTQVNTTDCNEQKEEKEKKENNRTEESTETADNFSPLNPPEIEYEDQNEK